MPMTNERGVKRPDHLLSIFADISPVNVGKGELEALRALKREALALKDAIGAQPLEGVLLSGTALRGLFELL